MADGEFQLQHEGQPVATLKKGDTFGDLFQDGPSPKYTEGVANERTVVFRISITDFYFVLANHHELVQGLIKNSTKRAKVYS